MAVTDLIVATVRPKSPTSGSECGYTLIEVLVVLAIAAIMAAMMVGGARQLQSLLHFGERASAQFVADAVGDRVADDLAGALELPLLGFALDEQVSLAGSKHEVRFNAVVRIGFLKRALREVAFSVEASADRPTLVRTSLPRRLGRAERASGEEKLVLHPNITGITFRYMTRDSAGKALWLDEWSGQRLLPIAVQFQIELTDKGKQMRASRTVSILR